MSNSRIEAFSDGVIAIIITIMVLELKVPGGDTLGALVPLIPHLLSYVLSFIYVGIYWNNHHHMLHTCESVTGPILWASAYWILQQRIIAAQGPDSILKKAVGADWKGKLSPVIYLTGIAAAFIWTGLAQALYLLAALLWLVPDRRIEKVLIRE